MDTTNPIAIIDTNQYNPQNVLSNNQKYHLTNNTKFKYYAPHMLQLTTLSDKKKKDDIEINLISRHVHFSTSIFPICQSLQFECVKAIFPYMRFAICIHTAHKFYISYV